MPPEHDLDAKLRRAIAGDTAALMDVLEVCGGPIRTRLEHKIAPAHRAALDIDDVMQVTYIEAVLRLSRFRDGGVPGFVAWLSRLAENNLIDAVRSLEAARRPDPSRRVTGGGRSGSESLVALIDILSGSMTTPSRHAAHGEASAHMEAAIRSLPPDYEQVVRLYDLEGLPAPEVARKVGRSEGAVYMLRARAHERLREAMGPPEKFFSQNA